MIFLYDLWFWSFSWKAPHKIIHIFILEILKSSPIFMHRSICHVSIIKQLTYMRILLQDMIIHQYIQKCHIFLPLGIIKNKYYIKYLQTLFNILNNKKKNLFLLWFSSNIKQLTNITYFSYLVQKNKINIFIFVKFFILVVWLDWGFGWILSYA